MAIYINTGFIVWINDPYLAGAFSDRIIFNLFIRHSLENWEQVLVDGGYRGRKAVDPTGYIGYYD